MAKKLLQVYIEPDQLEYLDKLAEETRRSRASIVREIFEKHMEREVLRRGAEQ